KTGRPSRAPEKLLRALLLQVLYSVRSERMVMEQLDYNLLFRWFVGLNMDDAIWDATVFTKNRQRLLDGDIADAFFAAVLKQARQRNLFSDEHFAVDGTLLEAWAGQKSFRRVDDNRPPATGEGSNPTVNFHGESRSNETHCSTTDPDAMLARKSRGTGAVLAYRGHLLTEGRNGLVVSTLTTRAYGSAERDAALLMAESLLHQPPLPTRTPTNGVLEETRRGQLTRNLLVFQQPVSGLSLELPEEEYKWQVARSARAEEDEDHHTRRAIPPWLFRSDQAASPALTLDRDPALSRVSSVARALRYIAMNFSV